MSEAEYEYYDRARYDTCVRAIEQVQRRMAALERQFAEGRLDLLSLTEYVALDRVDRVLAVMRDVASDMR